MRKIFAALAAAVLATVGNAVSLTQFQGRDGYEYPPPQDGYNRPPPPREGQQTYSGD